ncbi:uncharacterized protein LOC108681518 [Hyalella azteca]|uniref:Uncharacterized protein LOC108681518 n=1 Tax=Hyalella azteca TaxID=294128 RepID=A0A8B7PJ85_HYAAZ|nr:uncharacterized protein LOC108681518 [Hyalella azteca]
MSSRKPFAELSRRQQQRIVSRCLANHKLESQHPEIEQIENSPSQSPVTTPAALPNRSNADTSASVPRKCSVQQRGALLEEWMERIERIVQEQKKDQKTIINKMERIERQLSHLISLAEIKSLGASEALQAPATSMTELDNIAKDPNLIQKLQPYIGCNSKMTVRRVLKRCMTRDLALHFSFTGLGERRTVSKQAFGSHLLCTRILGDAAALQMNDTREVLVAHIQAALRGARDWDGGRKLRLDAAASLSGVGSSPLRATVSTAGLFSCTSPAGSSGGPGSPVFLPSSF